MKILKYLFLLLLLFLITSSVFIITKNGSYAIKRSYVINVPKKTVFNFVSDTKNWGIYNPWKNKKIPILKIKFENDSLQQIVNVDNVDSRINWAFKDTLNQTKVTMSTSGELGFMDKFYSVLKLGKANSFGDSFDKSLLSINKYLTTEVNTFKYKINGFVKRDTLFYIQRPVACHEDDIAKKIKAILPKLLEIVKSTNTKTNGNPFLIYHKKDSITNQVNFSIAIPTKKKIYFSSESDIFNGQTNPFQAIKATLNGNYSHKKKVLDSMRTYMKKIKLEQSPKHKEIEILTVHILTEKLASKWVTEIYIPVRPKKVVSKKQKNTSTDSIKKIKPIKIIKEEEEEPLFE